ncbi:hypothetical protein JCM10908_003043 [Rhodotorula pacifica]|uniref:uncharacterized protein n=1 Tax=Rhodotorula pacifica TaxID=1495444 RepID=UPI00317449F1
MHSAATSTSPRLLEPRHEDGQPTFDPRTPYGSQQYATYPAQSYSPSDPSHIQAEAGPSNAQPFLRRQSGPAMAASGTGGGLVPLDQAVRLDRERTVRASSTTALPSWPSSSTYAAPASNAPFPPSPNPYPPASPTVFPISDRSPQAPARKLTKHRRSSSGFGRPPSGGPSSPTSITYARPEQASPFISTWQMPTSQSNSSPYAIASSPYPPRPIPPRPPDSYSFPHAQSPQPSGQPALSGQSASFPSRTGSNQHLSPYPPVRPSVPYPPMRTESEEEQFERARRESLDAEQARLAALAAADDRLLSLTLAESASSAAQLEAVELRAMEEVIRASREQEERRRAEEERQREAEEEAVRRAMEASRADSEELLGKGKGRAPMLRVQATEASDSEEDEALQLAVRLSLDEAARQHRWQQQQQMQQQQQEPFAASFSSAFLPQHSDYGVAETSAQAFERYSRPSEPSGSGAAPVPSAPIPPRRGLSLLEDDLPATLDGTEGDVLPPPPAYELPAHAPELDGPEDVIIGPGRPLPVLPLLTSARRPLPIPPTVPIPDPPHDKAPPHFQFGYEVVEDDRTSAATSSWMHPSFVPLHPTLTPSDLVTDPFDDQYEVSEHPWEQTPQSRMSTPVSVVDPAASAMGGVRLFSAVLARRSSQMSRASSYQTSVEEAYYEVGTVTPPEVGNGNRLRPLPVPTSVPPPTLSAPVSPSQGGDSSSPPRLQATAVSAPTSPAPAPIGSVPSFGGYVEEGSTILASERVLREVKWGFVDLDLSKSGRRPPLEYQGDFPRGAQLSLVADRDGRQAYVSFAVEARTWQGLLVYLMWHGNSRFEAAPSDLERDKAARGYQASVSIDFYRAPSSSNAAVSIRPPRVRARVTLLPLSSSPPQHPDSATSPLAITVISTPSFDAVNPNIRLELSVPPTLPIALSALATTLADAYAAAREAAEGQAASGRHGKSAAASAPHPSAGQQALVNAVELFRKLGGEEARPARGGRNAHEEERSLLVRMKARLRRRKGLQVIPVTNTDPSEGLPLPESALLITPFPIDLD